MESYEKVTLAEKRTKEDKLRSAILKSTLKFNGDRYEVSLIWNGEQTNFPTIFRHLFDNFDV